MKIAIQAYVQARKADQWTKGSNVAHGHEFTVFTFKDATSLGYSVVAPITVEYKVPDDWDPRPQQIEALKAKERQARADFQKTITDIQRQIAELQAIEMS